MGTGIHPGLPHALLTKGLERSGDGYRQGYSTTVPHQPCRGLWFDKADGSLSGLPEQLGTD